ncbi:hypothetical protein [Streptomyces odontomachi]|uniref:hypothetical protein n=1 Tax=Streptomyces odontomachi TaxID=2944940 RepID=UPI00210CD5DC|nr:hypothetical protein [Streptomyces sp. ODS25]
MTHVSDTPPQGVAQRPSSALVVLAAPLVLVAREVTEASGRRSLQKVRSARTRSANAGR